MGFGVQGDGLARLRASPRHAPLSGMTNNDDLLCSCATGVSIQTPVPAPDFQGFGEAAEKWLMPKTPKQGRAMLARGRCCSRPSAWQTGWPEALRRAVTITIGQCWSTCSVHPEDPLKYNSHPYYVCVILTYWAYLWNLMILVLFLASGRTSLGNAAAHSCMAATCYPNSLSNPSCVQTGCQWNN